MKPNSCHRDENKWEKERVCVCVCLAGSHRIAQWNSFFSVLLHRAHCFSFQTLQIRNIRGFSKERKRNTVYNTMNNLLCCCWKFDLCQTFNSFSFCLCYCVFFLCRLVRSFVLSVSHTQSMLRLAVDSSISMLHVSEIVRVYKHISFFFVCSLFFLSLPIICFGVAAFHFHLSKRFLMFLHDKELVLTDCVCMRYFFVVSIF